MMEEKRIAYREEDMQAQRVIPKIVAASLKLNLGNRKTS